MNIKYLYFLGVLFPLISCGHNHDEAQHAEEGEEHNHSEEILLEPEIAEKMGVTTTTIELKPFSESITVAGQIVDAPNSSSVVVAPTAGIVKFSKGIAPGKDVKTGTAIARIVSTGMTGGDANAIAKANLDAAKAEMERLKPLFDERIVTAKDYNAAVLAYEQAKAAYSSKAASGIASAVSSGVITELYVKEGEFVDAGTPIAAISSNTKLTLKADLPQRYQGIAPTLQSAIIESNSNAYEISAMNGKRIAAGVNSVSQKGYIPIYFEFDNNGYILPGSFVKVYLLGNAKDAIAVPIGALSEQQGAFFVYKRLDEEGFEKVPVTIGNSNGIEVQILNGLTPGEEIVSNGVVALRLAETAAVAPEGHSHNH